MKPFLIDARELYDYAVRCGYEPLIDKRFTMEINLRVSVQKELFGRGHTSAENEKFYRWCWEHYPHICQETMRPLHEYSAIHISHIMTRGAHPETAHDPRNVNILCLASHNKWENGNRYGMRIYQSNKLIIEQLKSEYAKLK